MGSSEQEHPRGGGAARAPKPEGKRQALSDRAGLRFPVAHFHNKLKLGNYAPHVNKMASVYLTAVLEYLVAEVLELAGSQAIAVGKNVITPRQIQLAVKSDLELNALMSRTVFYHAGVFPKLPVAPEPIKKRQKSKII